MSETRPRIPPVALSRTTPRPRDDLASLQPARPAITYSASHSHPGPLPPKGGLSMMMTLLFLIGLVMTIGPWFLLPQLGVISAGWICIGGLVLLILVGTISVY